MRTTNSVVVVRTDEMKIPSGRENKREAMSKLPIDETILAMWQRHNSSMGVYQRITRLSKQATSLNMGKSRDGYMVLGIYASNALSQIEIPAVGLLHLI